MNIDQQISTAIDALRPHTHDTQELYREACTLLFFRYGITPTANKLYQYVRKGSMSAPAEALSKFWEELREKSRVRIEHPDLPEEIKTAAGDLVASLWKQAQAAAGENLSVFRQEAEGNVKTANSALTVAEERLALARREIDQFSEAAKRDQAEILHLERELLSVRANTEGVVAQLTASGRQVSALESSLERARKDFAVELEKTRQALQRSEERCEVSEKRALLEIDRERTVSTRLGQDLAQAQRRQLEIDDSYRTEIARLQTEISEIRQKLGITEGTLQELRLLNGQQALQIQSLTTETVARETSHALLRRELELNQEKTGVLLEEVAKFRQTSSTAVRTTQTRRRSLPRPKE